MEMQKQTQLKARELAIAQRRCVRTVQPGGRAREESKALNELKPPEPVAVVNEARSMARGAKGVQCHGSLMLPPVTAPGPAQRAN
ncbi:hypothetical protein CCMA1212_008385 [Trichoderma ghanense]|uniref:Uncharacterized protein n=1 Tax=Trichoderma ghanense TaxID=65468 RepID=A0ABY2GW04_9HYPO